MPTGANSFPTTYEDLDTELLLAAYAEAPAKMRAILDGLEADDLAATPRPGKWSISEIAIHVTDSEIMGAARIRQTYAQSTLEFAFYNQDVWVATFGYRSYDARRRAVIVQLFAALREATLPILEEATDDDWAKTGIHPEMGPTTLRQLLELYADHGERHLEQILEIRRLLGKPASCELLLPKRLY